MGLASSIVSEEAQVLGTGCVEDFLPLLSGRPGWDLLFLPFSADCKMMYLIPASRK